MIPFVSGKPELPLLSFASQGGNVTGWQAELKRAKRSDSDAFYSGW